MRNIKKLKILHKKAKKLNIKITKKNKKNKRIYKTEKQLVKEIKMKKNKMKKNKMKKNKFGNTKNILVLCADSYTIKNDRAKKMLNTFPETQDLNDESNYIYIGTAWDDKDDNHSEKLILEYINHLSEKTRKLLNDNKPFHTIINEYCPTDVIPPSVVVKFLNEYGDENTYFISTDMNYPWTQSNFEEKNKAFFRGLNSNISLRYLPFKPIMTPLNKKEEEERQNGELYVPFTLSLYTYNKNKFGVKSNKVHKVPLNDLHIYKRITKGVGKDVNSLVNLTALNLLKQGITPDRLVAAGYPEDIILALHDNNRERAVREVNWLMGD